MPATTLPPREKRPMRSYSLVEPGKPFQVIDAPDPKPTGTEVLLKVTRAGVCHSDIHISDGFFDLGGGKVLNIVDRGQRFPITLGHEDRKSTRLNSSH